MVRSEEAFPHVPDLVSERSDHRGALSMQISIRRTCNWRGFDELRPAQDRLGNPHFHGSLGAVLETAPESKGPDARSYCAGFIELVRKASALKRS